MSYVMFKHKTTLSEYLPHDQRAGQGWGVVVEEKKLEILISSTLSNRRRPNVFTHSFLQRAPISRLTYLKNKEEKIGIFIV